MSAMNTISAENLLRLIGTPKCPAIVDVEPDNDSSQASRVIPTARRRHHAELADWAAQFTGAQVVVVCADGRQFSPGAAAWLRQAGIEAETLSGGAQVWFSARMPTVATDKVPSRSPQSNTVWVTRSRPKVDRIACPWLIRRFVDPNARFLFVAPAEVQSVAKHFDATPFDVEGDGMHWSHRGELCTFDLMLQELGLDGYEPLARLAVIVRGADTGRLDIAPEAPGLLAASLGLSRMYADDIEQLEAGLLLYDAFYRWCRDAVEEVHNWSSHKVPKPAGRP